METKKTIENELLTISQAADYLQLSDKTLRRLIKKNEIKASKIANRSWRIKLQDIYSYLNANTNVKMEEK